MVKNRSADTHAIRSVMLPSSYRSSVEVGLRSLPKVEALAWVNNQSKCLV